MQTEIGRYGLLVLVLGIFIGISISGASVQQSFAEKISGKEIPLWSGVAPGSEDFKGEEVYKKREHRGEEIGWVEGTSKPTLTVYLPTGLKGPSTGHNAGPSAGIVICPGGGYGGLAIDHEGHVLARWLCERGMAAGVLKYRCGGGLHQHPIPLDDAQRALQLMRSRAKEWNIDPDKIGVSGFSAGGHLASSAGTHFVEANAAAEDPLERVSSRANFLVLAYPVITLQEKGVTHEGSKKRLFGENPDEDLARHLSSELQVTADTGPTFLVHANDDKGVLPENSLRFYQALRKHKIPVELHIYEEGGHGFGLYRSDQPAARWPDLLEGWLRGRGLIE